MNIEHGVNDFRVNDIEKIPKEWFSASVGPKSSISFSSKFFQKFGTEVFKLMTDYGDLINHHHGGNGGESFHLTEEEESLRQKEKMRISKEVENITGFSIEKLREKRKRLEGLGESSK